MQAALLPLPLPLPHPTPADRSAGMETSSDIGVESAVSDPCTPLWKRLVERDWGMTCDTDTSQHAAAAATPAHGEEKKDAADTDIAMASSPTLSPSPPPSYPASHYYTIYATHTRHFGPYAFTPLLRSLRHTWDELEHWLRLRVDEGRLSNEILVSLPETLTQDERKQMGLESDHHQARKTVPTISGENESGMRDEVNSDQGAHRQEEDGSEEGESESEGDEEGESVADSAVALTFDGAQKLIADAQHRWTQFQVELRQRLLSETDDEAGASDSSESSSAMDDWQPRSFKVPDALICSMLIRNGQHLARTEVAAWNALFGQYSFYHSISDFRLQPLEMCLHDTVQYAIYQAKVKAKLRQRQRIAAAITARAQRTPQEERSKRRRGNDGNHTSTSSSQQAGDVEGESACGPQVPAVGTAEWRHEIDHLWDDIHYIFPFTLSQLGLEGGVQFMLDEEGRVVRRSSPEGTFHVVAPSFVQFFEQYVTDMTKREMFAISVERGINRFPLLDPCGSDTVTRNIRIRASVLFVPEQSRMAGPEQGRLYFFTYHIRIDSTETAESVTGPPTRATLISRHWIIEDGHGHVEHVNGPGVIGFYPSIYPGCPQFTYESCSHSKTPTGKMSGSFRFKVESTDEEFDAIIQPFIFDINRNYC